MKKVEGRVIYFKHYRMETLRHPPGYERGSIPGIESAGCLMGMMTILGSLWTFSGGLAKGDGSGSV